MSYKIEKYPVKRIAVFDFDGTLVDTPLPTTGKDVYKEKTGKEWPHRGWWSQPDTLDMDIFDIPVIETVIEDYKLERAQSDTLVIMLTGRIPRLSTHVEKILKSKGLSFDAYFYNTGGQTLDHKIKVMQTLINQFPEVTSLKMWDDRLEHIPAFQAWGEGLDIQFDIRIIEGNHHGPQ